MKLRAEIEPKTEIAEKNYHLIKKAMSDYTDLVDEKGDEDNSEFAKLVNYLSHLTGKIDIEENYCIWEYWEADGLERESYKLALPAPVKVENLQREEIVEIVERIVNLTIPKYLQSEFIEENGFVWEIIDYYHNFLKLNLKKYKYGIFNRQKDINGEWYEPTKEEIIEKLMSGS